MLHLRSSIGFSIALSIELHLESFCQLINPERKIDKNFGKSNWWLTSLLRRALKVLYGTSWERPGGISLPGTSLNLQIRASPERHLRMSTGRQIGRFPGWSNRIFRGRPGDAEVEHPRDVLGTNIWQLGKWVVV